MEKINNDKLLQIVGGINITGTLISSLAKGISTIYGIGRALGSAIRRGFSGKLCSL